MKLIIVLAAVTLAQADKLDRVYLPPNAQVSGGSGSFLQTPRVSNQVQDSNAFASNAYAQNAYSEFNARPERVQAARERNAAILRQDNSNDGETYSYAYETENGIYAEESGVATNGVQAQGGYSYTGDDGKVYSVRYTADENGFQPQGDHLPTPPPIPEEILKALEQNARDEAAGIFDDGSYNDVKYSAKNQPQYYSQNVQPQAFNYNDDAVVTNSAFLGNDASTAANNANSVAAIQKAYLPPFAQRNGARKPTFDAKYSGNYRQDAAPQAGNFNDDSVVTNSALFRNDAATAANNGNSVAAVQKAYLPPFAQRNSNQRSSGRRPSFNARSGYRY